MEVTKPYEFIRFGAMDATKPYEFIGFWAMEGPFPPKKKPYMWAAAVIAAGMAQKHCETSAQAPEDPFHAASNDMGLPAPL